MISGSDVSDKEAVGRPSSLVLLIVTLCWPHCQHLPCKATKMAGVVMWDLYFHYYPHSVYRMILYINEDISARNDREMSMNAIYDILV